MNDKKNYKKERDIEVIEVKLRREFKKYENYLEKEEIDKGEGKKVEEN